MSYRTAAPPCFDCCCFHYTGNTPGCYCGLRSFYECFVDTVALPCLKFGCSQCLVDYCAGPTYRTCDQICCIDSRPAGRPSHPDAAKSIVVLTIRPVKEDSTDTYKEAYGNYAKEVQKTVVGVRAMFSFMDTYKKYGENMAIQVAFYDSAEVLTSVLEKKDEAVEVTYAPAEGAIGAVFGDRSEAVKTALNASGVTYEFGTLPRGFVKSAPHPGFSDYEGPPMIWISKRFCKKGRQEYVAKAFQKAADLQYYNAPAFLGGFEYRAEDDEDKLWSLRFFNDFEMGHVAHFPKTVCSWIPSRVLFTMIPELAGGLGAEFPIALSFSTKENIEAAIKYNAGNKAYQQYYWEDVIGLVPNMGDTPTQTADYGATKTRAVVPTMERS